MATYTLRDDGGVIYEGHDWEQCRAAILECSPDHDYEIKLIEGAPEHTYEVRPHGITGYLALLSSERLDSAPVRCACGRWSGQSCDWEGDRDDTVIVEFMPEYLRASHVAAGYSCLQSAGVYPVNGAERIRVEEACAGRMLEDDPDWCRVVDEEG